MSFHTHYDNLKVARNAPAEVIRAAYRALAQRYHPDLNPSPEAERIMKVVNEAYAVLSDPLRRADHDAWIEGQIAKESINPAPTGPRKQDNRQYGTPQGADGRAHSPSQSPPPTASPASEATENHWERTVLGICVLVCGVLIAWFWVKGPSPITHASQQPGFYNTQSFPPLRQATSDPPTSQNNPTVSDGEQISARELLLLICDAQDIEGSTCLRAKGYPEQRSTVGNACNVALRGARAKGHFLSADTMTLLADYESDCEPHATNWGGALLFEARDRSLDFKGYQQGLRVNDCASIPGGSRRDRLFCISGFLGQGHLESALFEVVFTQDFGGGVGTSTDVLVHATDSTGAWGANRVECGTTLALFSLSSPKGGTEPNTVLVQTRYADGDVISKACAPDRLPPTGVHDPAPSGMAWLNDGEIREGWLLMNLETRRFANGSAQRMRQ